MRDAAVIAPALLAWYDRHARDLPWRVPPGQGRGDPYRVWLSEVMLQQTTVAAVRGYYARFLDRWPTVQALAAADDAQVMAEWAGLGYYARARNLLACARAVSQAGEFPRDRKGLQALPGIGAYTSAAIAAIAYDASETVVDGNVERVTARLFAVIEPLPGAKATLHRLAETLTPRLRPGDFAQAMMDLGATICTPRSPACDACPLAVHCGARAAGIAAALPARAPKTPRPHRHGTAWIAAHDGAVMVERRPARGLLGGTLAFPSTGWDGSDRPAPGPGPWRPVGVVRHVFTHFTLDLAVHVATLDAAPNDGQMIARGDLDPQSLPGLMRKVWAIAKDRI